MFIRETSVFVVEKKKDELSSGAVAVLVIFTILGGIYGGWPGGLGAFFFAAWLVMPNEKKASQA
jgi:phage shock protein PspC (stress-responsive transcriptional regulator)